MNKKLPRRSHHLCAASHGEVAARFFASVKTFCATHGIAQPNKSPLPFPHNIKATFAQLSRAWEQRNRCAELFIACEEGISGAIGTIESVPKKYDLYHICIASTRALDHNPKKAPALQLLLCIFAYLRHVVGFANYNGQNLVSASFDQLYWSLEGGYFEDEKDRKQHKKWMQQLTGEIAEAKEAARWLDQRINTPLLPEQWKQALHRLRPTSDWEHKLLVCSTNFYALYSAFPTQSMTSISFPGLTCSYPLRTDEDPGWLEPADIFSFTYWPKGTILWDEIPEYIDSLSQERYIEHTPALLTLYNNRTPRPMHDPSFTSILFELLDQFSDLTTYKP